jgi:hypothetical protein
LSVARAGAGAPANPTGKIVIENCVAHRNACRRRRPEAGVSVLSLPAVQKIPNFHVGPEFHPENLANIKAEVTISAENGDAGR